MRDKKSVCSHTREINQKSLLFFVKNYSLPENSQALLSHGLFNEY